MVDVIFVLGVRLCVVGVRVCVAGVSLGGGCEIVVVGVRLRVEWAVRNQSPSSTFASSIFFCFSIEPKYGLNLRLDRLRVPQRHQRTPATPAEILIY